MVGVRVRVCVCGSWVNPSIGARVTTIIRMNLEKIEMKLFVFLLVTSIILTLQGGADSGKKESDQTRQMQANGTR
jgi:hypothetical protein